DEGTERRRVAGASGAGRRPGAGGLFGRGIRAPAEGQQDVVAGGGEQPGGVPADPARADHADLHENLLWLNAWDKAFRDKGTLPGCDPTSRPPPARGTRSTAC